MKDCIKFEAWLLTSKEERILEQRRKDRKWWFTDGATDYKSHSNTKTMNRNLERAGNECLERMEKRQKKYIKPTDNNNDPEYAILACSCTQLVHRREPSNKSHGNKKRRKAECLESDTWKTTLNHRGITLADDEGGICAAEMQSMLFFIRSAGSLADGFSAQHSLRSLPSPAIALWLIHLFGMEGRLDILSFYSTSQIQQTFRMKICQLNHICQVSLREKRENGLRRKY